MDNLLYGKINPNTVSKIRWNRGYRMDKVHPYFYRLHKKKYGFFAWKSPDRIFYDWWNSPSVEIHGSDGSVISHITCRSNDHAEKLKNKLETQLDEWVELSKRKKYE